MVFPEISFTFLRSDSLNGRSGGRGGSGAGFLRRSTGPRPEAIMDSPPLIPLLEMLIIFGERQFYIYII